MPLIIIDLLPAHNRKRRINARIGNIPENHRPLGISIAA
jgi:hypothetical protein